ncbi:MAG: PIN domain nuclease [Sedimentisphaerales bacterium]|nr:PIN domain nuclease [Sedimentisphaerales bacterium]
MIVADSSVWIDYFNGVATGQAECLHTLLAEELVLMGDIILAEVLQGFREDNDFHKANRYLATLDCARMLNRDLAIKSAQNYRRLRRKGVTIRRTIDVMIATFCIERNLALLHSDKDFEPMSKYLSLKSVM